ncbi:globin [Salininema proteolyticum]|uniref:Globin n=1 Tax=Salininema proteolyticum TaxID=1607685 RepID=A0ABV8TVG6_9ACTN
MATSDSEQTTASPSTGQGTIPLRRKTEAAPVASGGSFYELVGGSETFRRIAASFYENVRQEPLLLPLYPQDDLDGAARRLQLFLEQYWGGPHTYQEERGHPRLRMRHAPYKIGIAERDAWLRAMRGAMDSVALAPEHDQAMWEYMVRAADFMRNTQEA